MGFVQNAEQLVLLRALQGAVTGVVAAANALVAAQTPREHSGFALGLVNMARWTGTAGGPLVGGLIAESFGFRQSFWITGLLLGLAGLAVVFFVREEFTPFDRMHSGSFWESFWRGYRSLFAAPGVSGLYSLTFLRSLGATLTTPILSLFVLSLNNGRPGGTAALTGAVIGTAALTSAISAVYLGRLGDRIGHTRVLIGSAIAAMLIYAPQAWVQSAGQLIILQALGGFAVGGLVPSVAALLNLWAPAGNQGATYGLDNSVQASGRVVAPMIAASLAALAGYRGVFLGAALVYAVIAVAAALVVRSADRRAITSPPLPDTRL
jgi:DHA1 family multidrug resistance protein-like MFS transporter